MKAISYSTAALLVAASLGLLCAPAIVSANCGSYETDTTPVPRAYTDQAGAAGLLAPRAIRVANFQAQDLTTTRAGAAGLAWNTTYGGSGTPTIVGLWQFTMVSDGKSPTGPPRNAIADAGFVTWHADGTELMNSSRKPLSGNFCMGVWKQTGDMAYKLNHFALAWDDSTGSSFVGPANIRENIVLGHSGNTYYGTFRLIQYLDNVGGSVLADFTGTVTATRITVD